MKQAKHFRRLMSFFLIVTMLLSMTVVGLVGVSAAEDGPTLTYSFKYDNAGYAEGRVRLTASSELDYDKYTLYWADDTKALEGYAPITTLNLNQQSKSFTFGEFTAIPAGATKLIAVESALAVGDINVALADAVYDIPESKQFKYSADDAEYTFQTLSDIHIHRTNYYEYAEAHFASALEAAAVRGAEFVSTCGDNTNYGDDKEWGVYLNTIANSDFTGPVYEVNGNHEPYDQGEIPNATHSNTLNQYKLATGLNVETEKMQSELYYEVTASNGDHHIYMALELVNNKYHPGISDNFTEAQIDWLEGLLNKYKNDGKKIFIYEHAPFAGYGAGDNKVTPHYGAAMTIDAELYPQTYRFKELLESNKDIVWFSGHTHIDFKYNYNIDNENGTTAYTVHVPSSASTTTVNASGGLDYVNKADSAQGYFVDVYADAVVLNGTDLVKNEILPLYTYLVDYSGDELIENEVEEGEEANYAKVVVTVDASVFDAKSVKAVLYGADDETLSQSVTMTKDTDGLFKANVSTQFTKMKFAVVTDSFTINSAEFVVADAKVVLGAYKVAFDNTYNWANVNVYAWNTAGGELAAWPGVAMTKEADGTYTAVIPDFPDKIIFNNGSGQTDDLDIASYITETIEGSYTVNSTPTPPVEEDTTPTPDPEPVETVTIYLEKPDSWEGAYVYGFYGVEGGTATGEPLGTYPGSAMTLVEGSIYSYEVPADIDYIKFVDGSATNRRTNNVPSSNIGDNVVYNLVANGSKWDAVASAYTADIAAVGATASNYAIRGTFTDWGSNDALSFKDGSNTVIEATYTLAAGEYKFKVYNMSTSVWYGNGGTIDGACDNWGFRDGNGDATLNITEAGKYTITVDVADSARLGVTIAKAAEEVVPTTTEAPAPVPTTTEVSAPVPTTTEATAPVPSTVKIYFTNNENWENVYIYGFYGVEGQTSTGEPLGTYPGTQMTVADTNSMGQDIYVMEVPADISYIKFSDGTSANERTNNIPNSKIADGYGFYLTEKVSGKWNVDTYEYVAPTPTPTTTEAPVVVPTTTEAPVVVPTTTEALVVVPTTTEAPVVSETITVYFTRDDSWEGAYIYGFYGVEGGTATGEPLGTYPGTEMTFVEVNGYGQEIYSMDIPADIDYIKFSDGSATNRRTVNIPNADLNDGYGFYIKSATNDKWSVGSYEYVPTTTPVPTTTEAPVVVPTTTEAPVVVPTTTEAPVVVPTTTVTSATMPEVVRYLYGDADLNGIVNVKDATLIQKYVAGLAEITDEFALKASDVDVYTGINVKDATAIQKMIADLIDILPAGEYFEIEIYVPVPPTTTEAPVVVPTTTVAPIPVPTTTEAPTPVPDGELTKLLAEVKETLENEVYYASYVAYAGLKKAYYNYKDANVATMSEDAQAAAVAEINAALADYNKMKANNPGHIEYTAPKAGTYLIRGTMNSWDESGVMEKDGNGYSITYTLAAGEHELKVYDTTTSVWYGNGGTFTDTCTGWTMSDTAGNLVFTATGGTYKFVVTYESYKVKLTVTKIG